MARLLCLPISLEVASEYLPRVHPKVSYQPAAVQQPPYLAVATSIRGLTRTTSSFSNNSRIRRTLPSEDETGTHNTSIGGSEVLDIASQHAQLPLERFSADF